jgi:hypothetical protein
MFACLFQGLGFRPLPDRCIDICSVPHNRESPLQTTLWTIYSAISFIEKCQMIDRENGLVVLSFIFTEDIKVAQYQND